MFLQAVTGGKMTVRAVVVDSASLFRLRTVTALCAANSSMRDVLSKLHTEAPFVIPLAVLGTRYLKARSTDGAWMSESRKASAVAAFIGPASIPIDPDEILSSFVSGPSSRGLDDVHLIIHVPPEYLPRDYDDVIAQFFRRTIITDRIPTTPQVKADDVVCEQLPELCNVGLPPSLRACFQTTVYARKAECLVLKMLLKKVRDCKGDWSQLHLALVGSPGVGKSTLTQRLCWELMKGKIDVFYLHCVKPGGVVLKFFTKTSHLIVAHVAGSSVAGLLKILSVAEGRAIAPLIILDGFPMSALATTERFHITVSSGGFDEPSFGSDMILLPSWSRDEVQALAGVAERAIGTKLMERYAKFGGDLRNLLAKDQESAERGLYAAIDCVNPETLKILHSVHGRSTSEQVDRIRRYHVLDPSCEKQYWDSRYWVAQIESLYLQRALTPIASPKWIEEIYRAAKHTLLYPFAYEMLSQSVAINKKPMSFKWVRTCVSQPTRGKAASTVQDPINSTTVDVNTKQPSFEGTSNDTAEAAMTAVARGEATYWAPKFANFPEIDAVARCTLVISSKRVKVIGMLQYTVGAHKEINLQKLKALKDKLEEALPTGESIPIMLFFVTPMETELTVNFVPYDMGVFHVSYDGPTIGGSALTPMDQERVDHVITRKRRRVNAS